jgi:arylsulfatase A-like enzyme/Tfp pilus assembly protein PilF
VDTLRADRLGAYGWEKAETPAIDALARRGTLFEHAFTVAPITLPAHASVLTGRFPSRHGIRGNSFYTLDEAEITLAEVLRASGYRTGAVVGAAVLDRRFGLNRGFDFYDDEMPGGRDGLIADRSAASVVSRALAWLASVGTESPFFLWVHLFDPHHPYEPPQPLRFRFDGAPYDGEVAYVDGEIQRLLSSLESTGALRDTLIVLTSDHGESLGEHGEDTHGVFLYDATLHVPLIVAGPGVPTAVRRGDGPVSVVDIVPTVVAKLNVRAPDGADGVDLFARARNRREFVYAETYLPRDFYNWAESHALRSSDTKFVHSPVPELYDLTADPRESRNRAAEAAGVVSRLTRTALEAARGAKKAQRVTLDPELASRLHSLGYVASGGPAFAADDDAGARPDAKARIHLVRRIDQALALKRAGRAADAAARLREILSEDPHNYLAAHTLGDVLFDLQHDADAVAAYRVAMRGRDVAYYHYRLGVLHERMGQYPAAAQEFGKLVRLTPDAAKEIVERAEARRTRGSRAAARAYLEALAAAFGAASASAPDQVLHVQVLNALGVARGETDDLGLAAEAFTSAARIAPADFDAHANLALTRARQGQAEASLASLARALELRPNETRLLNLAAELRFRRNELDAARELLSRSLAIDPGQPRIVRALRQVNRRLAEH